MAPGRATPWPLERSSNSKWGANALPKPSGNVTAWRRSAWWWSAALAGSSPQRAAWLWWWPCSRPPGPGQSSWPRQSTGSNRMPLRARSLTLWALALGWVGLGKRRQMLFCGVDSWQRSSSPLPLAGQLAGTQPWPAQRPCWVRGRGHKKINSSKFSEKNANYFCRK